MHDTNVARACHVGSKILVFIHPRYNLLREHVVEVHLHINSRCDHGVTTQWRKRLEQLYVNTICLYIHVIPTAAHVRSVIHVIDPCSHVPRTTYVTMIIRIIYPCSYTWSFYYDHSCCLPVVPLSDVSIAT